MKFVVAGIALALAGCTPASVDGSVGVCLSLSERMPVVLQPEDTARTKGAVGRANATFVTVCPMRNAPLPPQRP